MSGSVTGLSVSGFRARAAAMVCGVLAGSLLWVPPVVAAPGGAPSPGGDRSVAVRPVPAKAQVTSDSDSAPGWVPSEVAWPSPGSAVVDVPAVRASRLPLARAGVPPVAVGGLPVRVSAVSPGGDALSGRFLADRSDVPGRVRVDVVRVARDPEAGLPVVLRLSRADAGSGGRVRLEVDYRRFRDAFGGDWSSRLRLVGVPACAAVTPRLPECMARTGLGSWNNATAGVVTAEVDLAAGGPSGGVVLAVAASGDSDAGTFARTPLSQTYSWQAGESGAGFTWNYPLRVPPVAGGLVPEVSFGYSTAAVDGRTNGESAQNSWLGEGWDYQPGYIERRYRACADDNDDPNRVPHWQQSTPDLCWRDDNATLVWGGRSTELVRDDATGRWHPAEDDGSRVQKLTSGVNTGYKNDEHWVITTQDGTQFWFGRTQLPGWSAGDRVTNSVWGVPAVSNHSGEPCFSTASYGSSVCTMAWRWNLDYVLDPDGNSMSYWYTRNQSRTGFAGQASPALLYDRGGWLSVLEYGTRRGNEATATPPARVVFGVGDRCLSSCWDADGSPNQPQWPDTPWDLHCSPSRTSCANNISPSFFQIKRLDSVTTQIRSAGAWQNVDQWSLDHTFPDTLESAVKPALWLDDIVHTGLVGGSQALPAVHFGGIRGDNRTDYNLAAGVPKVKRYRIQTITTETGGQLILQYNGSDCTPTDLPNPDQNAMRCFPQFYSPPGSPPGWSWWNKYRILSVTERDLVGGSPDVVTEYAYTNGGSNTPVLWHHDDDAWGANLEKRSWSDFRGYPTVHITKGAVAGQQTRTELLFFRGMDGDRTDAGPGTRNATITTSTGVTMTDLSFRRGFLRERIDYNAPGGTALHRVIHEPWTKQTGTRTESASHAQPSHFQSIMLRTANTLTSDWLAHNGTWRNHQVTNEFDDTYGTLSWTADFGDPNDTGDTVCTKHLYPRNTTAWLVNYVGRTERLNTSCTATPVYPQQFLGEERIFYDGNAASDAAPTKGNPTKTSEAVSHDGTNPISVFTSTTTYDPHGRVLTATDAIGRTTTTAYTPTLNGPVTGVTVTNPAGHVTTTTLSPAWGAPTTVVDANGKTTTAAYDPLGRLTKVWLPGRPTNGTGNSEYVYTISRTTPSRVQTKTLGPNGNQISSYETYDGLVRPRQTQTPAPAANGGRMIADVQYDSRGLSVKESTFYNATSGPTGTLVGFTDAAVASQRRLTYDALDRQTSDQLWSLGVEKWRTTTSYDGDRSSIDPPAGGTPATTIIDARGRTAELRQYHGAGPSGSYDATSYGYDVLGRMKRVTDPAGNDWTWQYDLRGRKIGAADPDKGATTMTYDHAGQLLTTTDARNVTLAYAYDNLGRKTAVHRDSTSGPKLASWTFDTLVKGQLSSSTRHHDGKAYTTAVTNYDDGYRPLGSTVTIPAGEGDLTGTWTAETTYRVNGAPATQTYPAAGGLDGEEVTYTYDDTGALLTLTGFAEYVTGTSYDPWGTIRQRTLGGGSKRVLLTTTLDEATRRLTAVQTHTERPGTPGAWDEKLTLRYAQDPAGNVTSIAETAAGATVSNECFNYDHQRRLTHAWTTTASACQATPTAGVIGGPDPYWHSYTYDVTGNRTSEAIHATGGAPGSTRTYAYPTPGSSKPHALTSITGPAGTDTFGYNEVGDTTTRNLAGKPGQTLTWDLEGHLATLTENGHTSSYLYDAAGNRLIRRTSTGATLYLGATEIHDTPTGPKNVRYYTHAGAVIASRTSSAELNWHTDDHHGTAQTSIAAATLAVTRRKQTPFGGVRGAPPSSWPTERGFVGGTNDPTGLVHLGAREYDSTTGRFISLDPIIDPSDPQQIHGYAYAKSNPTTLSDSTGQIPEGMSNKDYSKRIAARAIAAAATRIATAPVVTNTRLRNVLNGVYARPGVTDVNGDGTVHSAVRNEFTTGQKTGRNGGKWHYHKAASLFSALSGLLEADRAARANNLPPILSESDRLVAESELKKLWDTVTLNDDAGKWTQDMIKDERGRRLLGNSKRAIRNGATNAAAADIVGAEFEEVLRKGEVILKMVPGKGPKYAGVAKSLLLLDIAVFALDIYNYGFKGALERFAYGVPGMQVFVTPENPCPANGGGPSNCYS